MYAENQTQLFIETPYRNHKMIEDILLNCRPQTKLCIAADITCEGEKTEENVLRVRKEFIPYYDIHNADDSRPYPGISALLSYLQSAGIQIAVASNKYQAATEKLVAHYFPEIHFTAVFGQREGVNVKPDPTIVFDILKLADVRKEDVLYV